MISAVPPRVMTGHDPLEIAQHGAFIAVIPEPIQALLEHVGFEELAVESKQRVEFLPLARTSG